MGDPAGVGPELCLRLFTEEAPEFDADLTIFGSDQVLNDVSLATGIPVGGDLYDVTLLPDGRMVVVVGDVVGPVHAAPPPPLVTASGVGRPRRRARTAREQTGRPGHHPDPGTRRERCSRREQTFVQQRIKKAGLFSLL